MLAKISLEIGSDLTTSGGKKSWRCEGEWSTPFTNWTNFAVNDPLQKTLAAAAGFLVTEGIAYALIGGMAASLRGQMRTTADVDLGMFKMRAVLWLRRQAGLIGNIA